MEEGTILKISLLTIIAGLIFLFLYVGELELPVAENLNAFPSGEVVEIKGVVQKISQHEKVIFLEVWGERVEKVEVILFNDKEIFLKEGDYVEITGTVADYQGKKEIIAQKAVLK